MRPTGRLRLDQVATDVDLVRALLTQQLPELAGLPVVPVSSWGTDHDVYRLGDRLAVRLPKIGWAVVESIPRAG